jgi:RNA polymerase sigma factor (sigma-70 family)
MRDEPSVNGAEAEATAVPDRELLSAFVFHRDARAFETIVRRHGPMVYGVVRRILRDPHACDDAFQATFLVLARSAGRIRRQQSLASWLHGVAHRIARRALCERYRRQEQAAAMEQIVANPDLQDVEATYEQQLLDSELEALPRRYREPLVLHYLEGLSNRQVADRLGLTVTAVEGRLKRAKKELRLRMTRRGVELSAIIALLPAAYAAANPATLQSLIAVATKAGIAASAGTLATHLSTPQAAALAGKELALMTTTTKFAAVLAVSVAVVSIVGFQTGNASGTGDIVSAANSPSIAALVAVTGQAEEGAPGAGAPRATGSGLPGAAAVEEQPLVPRVEGLSGDYRPRSKSVQRIQAALESETTIEFPGNPLRDVMDYLRQMHDIPVVIDEQALSDQGISSDEEVNLVISGVSLESAMNIILENVAGVPLDYIVKDEILRITTREQADQFLETRVYSVRDLEPTFTGTAVANAIRKSVQPRSWMHIEIVPDAGEWPSDASMTGSAGIAEMPAMVGGEGDAGLGQMEIVPDSDGNGTIESLPGCLVITQTQRIHRQIADLLDQLRQHAASDLPGPVPTYPGLPGGQYTPSVQELPLGPNAAPDPMGFSPVPSSGTTNVPAGSPAPAAPGVPASANPYSGTVPTAPGAPVPGVPGTVPSSPAADPNSRR